MAESNETEPAEDAEASFDTSATALAATLDEARGDPALRPHLAAFLDAQRDLVRTQIHHLHSQLAQLHVKTLGDRVRVGLQFASLGALLGLLVLAGLTVRDAMNDHGLVIESFSAPPRLAEQGLTGEALAHQMLGRIEAIRREANQNSVTVSDDVRSGGADSLKVEVPQTGLSLDEVDRYLHRTLGHAHRLSGEISEDGAGHVVVEAHVSQSDPIRVVGEVKDLDKLMQAAAEQAFAAFDPVNWVIYLRSVGRWDEAQAAADRNVAAATNPTDLANALSLSGNTDRDRERALRKAGLATEADPRVWGGWRQMSDTAAELGLDALAVAAARHVLTVRTQDQWRNHRPSMPYIRKAARLHLDEAFQDFRKLTIDTQAQVANDFSSPGGRRLSLIEPAVGLHDCEDGRRQLEAAQTLETLSNLDLATANWRLAVCVGDRAAALQAASQMSAETEGVGASGDSLPSGRAAARLASFYGPQLGLAKMRTGDLAGAQALIAASPTTCYLCVRARGQIAAAAGDKAAADRWFGEAVRQAPELPAAYQDWGEALLTRGDAPRAMAYFTLAHEKGPNWADPLKSEGDTLARRGERSAAVQAYDAALKIAPRWRALIAARAAAKAAGG